MPPIITGAYAQTLPAEEADKIAFYEELRVLVNSVLEIGKIILLGDFNARVGRDRETWSCPDRYRRNLTRILQVHTQFRHTGSHTTTWMKPRCRQWHLIDYIIVQKRDMQDICNVKSFKGADCWTDQALVRSMRLIIKPPTRNRKTEKLPKRLNVAKFHDPQKALQACLTVSVNSPSWPTGRE